MAGYSGTPLPKKLGIKANHRTACIQAPPSFRETLGELPPGVVLRRGAGGSTAWDVIILFVERRPDLEKRFAELAARLVANGALWVAWPKRASGKPTDLTEGSVREVGLAAGLVDNKVCAIDETWSGLRFVIRLKDRGEVPR